MRDLPSLTVHVNDLGFHRAGEWQLLLTLQTLRRGSVGGVGAGIVSRALDGPQEAQQTGCDDVVAVSALDLILTAGADSHFVPSLSKSAILHAAGSSGGGVMGTPNVPPRHPH